MMREAVVQRPDRYEWISLREAAEVTGYTYSTLREYARRENAPRAVIYRGRLLVNYDDVVDKWGLRGD